CVDDIVNNVSKKLKDFTDEMYQLGVPLTIFEGETSEQFNQAINYSSDKQVPIFIPAGDYYFTKDLIVNKKSILIGLNTVNFHLSNNAQVKITSKGSGSVLKNINLYGSQTNSCIYLDEAKDITLQKIKVENTNYAGIHFNHSKDIILDQFEIIKAWNDTTANANGGLYIFQSKNIRVSNGLIKDVKSKGINVGSSRNIHVENVEVDTTTDPAGDGLYSNGSEYVTFKKCKVFNAASNAVKLSRGTKYSDITECDLHVANSVGNVIRLQGASFSQ